ncbi:MAG: trypsin-like peptidase domain-containing protein [Bosea sp. (in: a-proteobacteria)]
MAEKKIEKIVVRHKTGSKANQVEELALGSKNEFVFGRDRKCDVNFDPARDDAVSRRHAMIRYSAGAKASFHIVDLDSSNGTFVNDTKVIGEAELLPEDLVELGKGGPTFVFDMHPRPEAMLARTRVISAIDAQATRVIQKSEVGKATAPAAAWNTTPGSAATAKVPPKTGVGKDTVQLMLGQERKNVNRTWMSVAAGLLVFLGIGGGAFWWRQQIEVENLRVEQAREVDKVRTEAQQAAAAQQVASTNLTQQLGVNAQELARRYGNSTVRVDFRWRIYDAGTGRPIYQKVVNCNNKLQAAFVRFKDGTIARWLTTDDGGGRFPAISAAGHGSGFVISEQGFILTNRHVAAGWNYGYRRDAGYIGSGMVYEWNGTRALTDDCSNATLGNLSTGTAVTRALTSWVPTSGWLFESKRAAPIGNAAARFDGRNEVLEVWFPGSKLGVNAAMVRSSTEADAALIKIESPQTLTKLELAEADKISVGERVMVLGFPGVSQSTTVLTQVREAGRTRVEQADVAVPTLTEGIISQISPPKSNSGDTIVYSTIGDAFQLSINSTGSGNSGGPVFNSAGKVIGLFTYGVSDGSTAVTYAIPIKHGRNLLQPQAAN